MTDYITQNLQINAPFITKFAHRVSKGFSTVIKTLINTKGWYAYFYIFVSIVVLLNYKNCIQNLCPLPWGHDVIYGRTRTKHITPAIISSCLANNKLKTTALDKIIIITISESQKNILLKLNLATHIIHFFQQMSILHWKSQIKNYCFVAQKKNLRIQQKLRSQISTSGRLNLWIHVLEF